MNELAEQIWKAFCGELTQPPTDDMKEALATAFRKYSDIIFGEGGYGEQLRFEIVEELDEIADSLEDL